MKPRLCSAGFALAALLASTGDATAQAAYYAPPATESVVASFADEAARAAAERVYGRSGALRVSVLSGFDPLHDLFVLVGARPDSRFRWRPLLGTATALLGEPSFSSLLVPPETPGVWQLEMEGADPGLPLTVITKVPFSAKRRGVLNGYHIGTYPTEGGGRTDVYAPPPGFIEVTPENQDLHVSEHFQLRHFLTKDQFAVWPKYVALSLELIDKLELVIQELRRMGVRADRMHVMSGFRTPQYNGPGEGGRAALSRHMWGDAADVWIDSDGSGHMDDLNGDGRVDHRDAEVIMLAVERVERKYPELVGGAGVYTWNGERGPFIHIDVRGVRSRW